MIDIPIKKTNTYLAPCIIDFVFLNNCISTNLGETKIKKSQQRGRRQCIHFAFLIHTNTQTLRYIEAGCALPNKQINIKVLGSGFNWIINRRDQAIKVDTNDVNKLL
jgi:hypothetical protein